MAITLSETVQAAAESIGRLNLNGDAAKSNGHAQAHAQDGKSGESSTYGLKKPAEVASQSQLVDPFNYVVSGCR